MEDGMGTEDGGTGGGREGEEIRVDMMVMSYVIYRKAEGTKNGWALLKILGI